MRKPIKLVAAVMSATLMFGACSPAYAVHKVKGHPVYLVNTTEIGKCKIKKNAIYIEWSDGVVDSSNGDGHVKGHNDWYIYYGNCRYKGKRLKKGTRVISYWPLDNDQWELARYDFIMVKNKPVKVYSSQA